VNGGYSLRGVITQTGRSRSYIGASRFNGNLVCLKSISYASTDGLKAAARELNFSFRLQGSNEHILWVHDWFSHWAPGPWIYLVMDYCEMSLLDYLYVLSRSGMRLPLNHIHSIYECLRAGLSFLEQVQIVHRDVTPSNILWHNNSKNGHGCWKLSDFGASCSVYQSRAGGFSGTLEYAAPEAIRCKVLCTKADVWSMGCVMWECVLGVRPFKSYSMMAFAKSNTDPSLFQVKQNLVRKPSIELQQPEKKLVRLTLSMLVVPNRERRACASSLPSETVNEGPSPPEIVRAIYKPDNCCYGKKHRGNDGYSSYI
jgi:serine/threonine protein kinase